jgi:hypothetical protein
VTYRVRILYRNGESTALVRTDQEGVDTLLGELGARLGRRENPMVEIDARGGSRLLVNRADITEVAVTVEDAVSR